MNALIVIEGVIILLLLVLVAGLLRSHADILRKLDALGAGEDSQIIRSGQNGDVTRTPMRTEPASLAAISGQTPLGDTASVALKDSRGYVLVAFMSTGCTTCKPFWKAFRDGMDMPRADIRPVIVTKGTHEESPGEIRERAPLDITTIMSSETWDAFRVPGTPYFQLVNTESGVVVGEGSAGSWPRLVEMIERSLGDEGVSPIALTTRQRYEDSSSTLRESGIEPGDPSLYERPS